MKGNNEKWESSVLYKKLETINLLPKDERIRRNTQENQPRTYSTNDK